MLLVQVAKDHPDRIEIAWMWLPTFVGQNSYLLMQIDKELAEAFPPPVEVTQEVLNQMHRLVVDYVCKAIPIQGLREYLEAIENVRDET